MTPYIGAEKSGITHYELLPNGIILQFKTERQYRYDTTVNEDAVIDDMRTLAEEGSGLASYISHNKPGFVRLD